jgi:hypothetical protein
MARLADSQLRVISMAQLRELGFSYDQIRLRVESGRLHPWFLKVFSVGTRSLVPKAVLLAAQLSLGPRSFVSHRSAAAMLGLRAINTREIISLSRAAAHASTTRSSCTAPGPTRTGTICAAMVRSA